MDESLADQLVLLHTILLHVTGRVGLLVKRLIGLPLLGSSRRLKAGS